MERLADQIGQLVSVLTHHGDSHCAWPVVVEVGQLVGQSLDVLRLQSRGVLDDVVAGWVHGTLSDGLRYEEEVVSKELKNRHKLHIARKIITFQEE